MPDFVDREIVDTVQDALLVLDCDLVVAFANRSFYQTFAVSPDETEGRQLYELGGGQWDIPALRTLLEKIIPRQTTIDGFEVEHTFPRIGHRVMVLNARKLYRPGNHVEFLLLAINDITARRALERERERLSAQVTEAAKEASHRIKNSFQLLQGFAVLQRRAAESEETKAALSAISDRISAIGRLYEALSNQSALGERLPVDRYLGGLCADLKLSAGNGRELTFEPENPDLQLDADRLVVLGLAVNELVTNALKHAFVDRSGGKIAVRVAERNGKVQVSVEDDGRGIDVHQRSDSGLGQRFLRAFVERLNGTMTIRSGGLGTIVNIELPIA